MNFIRQNFRCCLMAFWPLANMTSIIAAATTSASTESYIHFDRPFYLSGERIYYQIYLPGHSHIAQSILQIDVIQGETSVLLQESHLELRHGLGNACFLIPFEIPSGAIQFVAQSFDRSESRFITILETDVHVIKPSDSKDEVNLLIPQYDNVNVRELEISSPREEQLRPGQEVKFTLPATEDTTMFDKAVFSVSLSHQPFLRSGQRPLSGLRHHRFSGDVHPGSLLFFQRKIFNRNQSPQSNDIITVFRADRGKLTQYKTDGEGTVTWHTEVFHGSENVYFYDEAGKLLEVSAIVGPWLSEKRPVMDNIQINLTHYLRLDSIRRKIELALPARHLKVETKAETRWPQAPDYSISLKDFEQVKDLQSLTRLVLTPLRIRSTEEGMEPRMINPEQKPFFPEAPIFFIDHYWQADVQEVLSIKLEHVQSIDFYNTPGTLQHFGNLGRNGVVFIHTKMPALYQPGTQHKIIGVESCQGFEMHSIVSRGHLPNIGPLVYWNPMVEVSSGTRIILPITLNDNLGNFVLEIFGLDDRGQVWHGISQFEVTLP